MTKFTIKSSGGTVVGFGGQPLVRKIAKVGAFPVDADRSLPFCVLPKPIDTFVLRRAPAFSLVLEILRARTNAEVSPRVIHPVVVFVIDMNVAIRDPHDESVEVERCFLFAALLLTHSVPATARHEPRTQSNHSFVIVVIDQSNVTKIKSKFSHNFGIIAQKAKVCQVGQ